MSDPSQNLLMHDRGNNVGNSVAAIDQVQTSIDEQSQQKVLVEPVAVAGLIEVAVQIEGETVLTKQQGDALRVGEARH